MTVVLEWFFASHHVHSGKICFASIDTGKLSFFQNNGTERRSFKFCRLIAVSVSATLVVGDKG